MEPPAHLSPKRAKIWREVEPTLFEDAPPAIMEALAVQMKTARAARELIDADGLIVTDGKNNTVDHPAIGAERAAIKQIDALLKSWGLDD